MASSTTLSFRHIFGINTNVNDNISFTDDDTVVYVAGHSLVLYNTTDKRQRFIQSAEITESITAYSSSSGKRLAAVAEKGDQPSIHVFDLRTFRRKKSIVVNDIISKEIVSMQFSEDNQLILALGGGPDWILMCWNWAKAKLIAATTVSLGTPIYKCMFSPLDVTVGTVIGKDCVKFYRIGEKDLRPLQENFHPHNNCVAFCWMRHPDDHLLVGTDEGKIMVFRSGEFLLHVQCSPGKDYPISSLISLSGGFVAGSTMGSFIFFNYDETKDMAYFDSQFSRTRTIHAGAEMSQGMVISMALCPRDETLCGLTSDGQLLSLSVLPVTLTNTASGSHPKATATTTTAATTTTVTTTTQPTTSNTTQTGGQPTGIAFTVSSFHGPKQITGMDICVRKPLIITCSRDNSLRIWNFKSHELELLKIFPEEMYSVALHPTGLHCAVGFTDKVRAYHILVDDLRLCMEVPVKACRDCKFSNGGHVFAAANGNSIVVYDFYSGDRIADLRGHNSKVRSIQWMPSGYQLLSCGQDGAVYLWSLDGAKRTGEFVQKGTMYTSAVASHTSVIAVGNDRSLRELVMPDLTPNKPHDAGLVLTHVDIGLSKLVLFASTFEYSKPGYVRAYPYPLTGDFDDYPCTNSQISRMRLSSDEQFLIVTDEQGVIIIMELRNRQDRFQRGNASIYPELLVQPDWSDEILVTRAELDELKMTISELNTKVEELINQNDYQLKLKDMNYSDKLKETTEKFIQELDSAKNKLEMLQEIRTDYELEAIEKLKYMGELHQNNIQNLEMGFQAQIMEMVDAYQQLVRDRDFQIQRLDDQRKQLVLSHEKYMEDLTNEFERKLDEDRHSRLQREDERTELERELVETQTQLEDDIDTEIENMKKTFDEKLAASRETTLKYKGENGIMKKKFHLMMSQQEDQKEDMKALQTREKELLDQIKVLEKEVSAHKKEIKTRDVSIGEKEKRIYELKKKNQELDKFKFVLDYKIRELKQQIEPRQMEIVAMREKIKKMDSELERYHKTNSNLDVMIGDLRAKIDELQSETRDERMKCKQQENVIAVFRRDVQAAVIHIQTPSMLLDAVKHLIVTHGSMTNVKPRIDPEVESEYTRHREYLQHSVRDLKRDLEALAMANMGANRILMQNNMDLINDINLQRDTNRNLKIKVQAAIGRIRHLSSGTGKPFRKPAGGVNPKQMDAGEGINGQGSVVSALPMLFQDSLSQQLEVNDALNKMKMIAGNAATSAESSEEIVEPGELLERNRRRILALRAAIAELENRSASAMMNRGYSKEYLPPMDGISNLKLQNTLPDVAKGSTMSGTASKKKAGTTLGIALPPVHSLNQDSIQNLQESNPEYNMIGDTNNK